MSWTRRAARAAGAGVLLTAAAVQGFTRYVTRGSRQTLEEAIKWQGDHYDISFFSACRNRSIPLKDTRIIFCMWYYVKIRRNRTNM